MKIFARLIKHGFMTASSGKRAFPPATLKAIETAIAHGETLHRAEVRLIVEHSLHASAVLRRMTPRKRALDLFAKYRIWDTEENCGILIYLNLADRKAEIIADRGVNNLIGSADWQAVCKTMTQGFAQGEFHRSVLAALAQLNDLLGTHFPANGAHSNQLSDKPILL